MRGIVAGVMGFKYWGCDLSEKQIVANRHQVEEIQKIPGALRQMPEWVIGDSRKLLDDARLADFLFSCPPYGDLEEYRDDPNDLSNMDRANFVEAYDEIVAKAVGKLRNDSFANFVVGDYRDDNGYLRSLVSQTIQAFEKSGCRLYNAAILRMPLGSAAQRAEGMFGTNRKLVAVHQNVLVFCKGDWRKAVAKNSLDGA